MHSYINAPMMDWFVIGWHVIADTGFGRSFRKPIVDTPLQTPGADTAQAVQVSAMGSHNNEVDMILLQEIVKK